MKTRRYIVDRRIPGMHAAYFVRDTRNGRRVSEYVSTHQLARAWANRLNGTVAYSSREV